MTITAIALLFAAISVSSSIVSLIAYRLYYRGIVSDYDKQLEKEQTYIALLMRYNQVAKKYNVLSVDIRDFVVACSAIDNVTRDDLITIINKVTDNNSEVDKLIRDIEEHTDKL